MIKDLFFTQLKISVKEHLHGQRKVDTVVHIQVAIPKNLFEELARLGIKGTNSHFALSSPEDFNHLLDEGWSWRIFNKQGDFAFVTSDTVTYWMTERRPCEEFLSNGSLKVTHRGFHFNLKFARGIGNKFDFADFVKV